MRSLEYYNERLITWATPKQIQSILTDSFYLIQNKVRDGA